MKIVILFNPASHAKAVGNFLDSLNDDRHKRIKSMRYPKGQKEQTRRRILQAATRVFKRQGYQGAGVDAVMREAGLTHGGFYAHFKNKEALFAAVVTDASERIREGRQKRGEDLQGVAWILAMSEHYLSSEHRLYVEAGCPMPPLVSELGRAGEGPRQAFKQSICGWRDDIALHLMHLPESQRKETALGIISTLVGSMSIARAFDDEEEAKKALRAGLKAIEKRLLKPTTSQKELDS